MRPLDELLRRRARGLLAPRHLGVSAFIALALCAPSAEAAIDDAPRDTIRAPHVDDVQRIAKRRKKPTPAPAPAPAPTPAPAEPAPVEAAPPTPPPTPAAAPRATAPVEEAPLESRRSGPSRIEFDDRLIQGQTNKANAIYLFERRASELRTLVRTRQHYHKEIDESVR